MTYDQQLALWMLAVILPFCINGFFNRHPDAIGLSAMLVVGWGFERVCWVIWTPPEAMQFYPVIDAAFGLAALTAWMSQPRPWKFLLAMLFIFQCALHASFWISPDSGNVYRYLVLNNITFALELCVAASPGVGSALAGLGRIWGTHHSGARPHASP